MTHDDFETQNIFFLFSNFLNLSKTKQKNILSNGKCPAFSTEIGEKGVVKEVDLKARFRGMC